MSTPMTPGRAVRRWAAVPLLVVLGVTVAACGSSGDSATTDAAGSSAANMPARSADVTNSMSSSSTERESLVRCVVGERSNTCGRAA